MTCKDCGAIYDAAWKAVYCARQDADPRLENMRLRVGWQATVIWPIGWATP